MNINTMTFVAPNLACGKARGGSISRSGSVTDEQRSHRPNSAQPSGRQFFFDQTSLLAPHRPLKGMLVARASSGRKIPRRERHRSYAHDHLASAQKLRYLLPWLGSLALVSGQATVRVIRESVGTMNIHHLELFYYVARHGGISEAVRNIP